MRAMWVALLVGGFLVAVAGPAVEVTADDKGGDDAAKPGPAPQTGAPAKTGEKPAGEEKPPSDKDLTQGLQEAAGEAKEQAKEAEEEPTPKRPPTPFGRKLEGAERLARKARAMKAKIPAMEAKVNAVVAKLTDSSKQPVDTKTLRQQLAENRVSKAAKTFRNLHLAVAREYEKVKGLLLQVRKNCAALEQMRTSDDDLKVAAEALGAGAKEEIVEVLTKLIAIYELIHDEAKVTACYRQILAIDRENVTARAYFKELAEKQKNPKRNSGGADYTHGYRPSTGHRGY